MPGSFDSSVARSSIAPTLKRELEGKVQATGQPRHFLLRQVSRFFLRFVDGHKDQILEHIDILGIRDAGVDIHPRDSAFAIGFDGHHSTAGRSRDGLLLEIRLDLLHPRLHLLSLLKYLRKISHCLSGE
jgi:hypothetical protein